MTKALPTHDFATGGDPRLSPTQHGTVTKSQPNTSLAPATQDFVESYNSGVILTTCEKDGPPPWAAWHDPNNTSIGYRPIRYFNPYTAMCSKHDEEETAHAVEYEPVPYNPDPEFQSDFDPSVGFPNKNVASLPLSALERSARQHSTQHPPYSETPAASGTCTTQDPNLVCYIVGDAKTNEDVLEQVSFAATSSLITHSDPPQSC